MDGMEPFLKIPNHHIESCGEPPMINGDDENVYIGYFENKYREQWVFTYDRRTKHGELRGGDVDWSTVFAVEDDGTVSDLILSPEEWLWLRSCWCTATGARMLSATPV